MSNKKYIHLNVDGTELDLPENNINLQLTYKNPCSEGFGTISGNKSERSFNLPASKQNDEVFENWWKVSQVNAATAPTEKDAFVEINGLTVLSGKAQLKDVSTQGRFYERQGKEYQISFVGSNADWFEQLKDLELGRDLDWSAEQHNLTSLVISGAFNNTPADLFAYAVLKFKDWGSKLNATQARVDVYECTPLLFIGNILTKAFNSIGYTLSSGFWSNPVNERYVLPVPLLQKYPQEYSEDYLNVAATFTAPPNQAVNSANPLNLTGINFDTQTKSPAVGPNPLVLSTPSTEIIGVTGNVAQYTAPDAGFYQWRLSVTVDNITGPCTFNFGFFGAGGGIQPQAGQQISLTPIVDDGKTYSFEQVVELEAGQVIETYFRLSAFTLDVTNASLEIIGEAKISPNSLIDFTYLLRDWKITDFIKGVTAAFNLCWETDVDLKTITCEPSDDYLVTSRALSSATIIDGFHIDNTNDFKPKLDFDKEGRVEAVNEIAEKQQYQWKQDSSDATAEAQNENEELPFDASRYDLPLNRFKRDTEENENPFFAPTLMLFDDSIRADVSTLTPLIPLLWPDNYRENPTAEENQQEFEPRILWFGSQRNPAAPFDGQINLYDSLTDTDSVVLLPACFFVNYNDPTGLDVSLNWATLTINGNTVQGHLQKFYLAESARQRQGKEVEEWIYWDELDISQLSFRDKIFIDGDMYLLKEINAYSPIIDATTKTILTYDCPPEQEDVNRITNTLAIGFVGNYNEDEQ